MPRPKYIEAKHTQIGDILLIDSDDAPDQPKVVEEIKYDPKRELVKLWYSNHIGYDLFGSIAKLKKVGKE